MLERNQRLLFTEDTAYWLLSHGLLRIWSQQPRVRWSWVMGAVIAQQGLSPLTSIINKENTLWTQLKANLMEETFQLRFLLPRCLCWCQVGKTQHSCFIKYFLAALIQGATMLGSLIWVLEKTLFFCLWLTILLIIPSLSSPVLCQHLSLLFFKINLTGSPSFPVLRYANLLLSFE